MPSFLIRAMRRFIIILAPSLLLLIFYLLLGMVNYLLYERGKAPAHPIIENKKQIIELDSLSGKMKKPQDSLANLPYDGKVLLFMTDQFQTIGKGDISP